MWDQFVATGDIKGVLAIVLSLGTPIIIVIAVLIYKAHRDSMMRETIQYMVDKGQPVPPELLNAEKPRSVATSYLHRGVVLAAVGIGLIIMMASGNDAMREHWGVMTIPLLLGLGYLLLWKVESGKGD